MRELLDPTAVERVLLLAGALGPVAGLAVGAAAGLRRRRVLTGTVVGALIGAVATLVYVMWKVYGAITDLYGLDSTFNLKLQILIFAVLGAGLGVLIGQITRYFRKLGTRRRPEKPTGSVTGGS